MRASTGGRRTRPVSEVESRFGERVTADGYSGFPAEAGRYHLYVSHDGCAEVKRHAQHPRASSCRSAFGFAWEAQRPMSWPVLVACANNVGVVCVATSRANKLRLASTGWS